MSNDTYISTPKRTLKLKSFEPTPQMHAVVRAFKDVLLDNATLHPSILLALASQLVGNLTAMQTPEYTQDMILKIIEENIEVGNRSFIDPLDTPAGEA